MWGDDVRRAREAAGLSQSELARRSHVSRKQLTLIEKNRNVSIETIAELAKHLPALRALSLGDRTLELEHERPIDISALRRAVDRASAEIRTIGALVGAEPDAHRAGEDHAQHAVIPFGKAKDKRRSPPGDLLQNPPPGAPFAPVQVQIAPMVEVPIVGYVAAGAPVDLLTDGHGETRSVPEDQAPESEWVALIARGDSMNEFGIENGDVVYVEPRVGGVAANGEIVIGWLNDGLVIKKWERRAGRKRLISGNPEYEPREITADDLWELKAIVRACVPRSRRITFPNVSGKKRKR